MGFLWANNMNHISSIFQQYGRRTSRVLFCVSTLTLSLHALASTYIYIGTPYSSVTYGIDATNSAVGPAPAPYNPTMYFTGRFETASRLPANMLTQTDIGTAGLNLMSTWVFNDGLLNYTPQNSALIPLVPGFAGPTGELSGSAVATDGLGNISGYLFWGNAPLPPHTVGQKVDTFQISANTGLGGTEGEVIGNQLTCGYAPPEFGNHCASSGAPFTSYMVNAVAGKWSSFDPLPITGTATFGTSAVAIPDILANDGINGVAATAGSSGNTVLTPRGTWPAGVTLDTNTGAVSISSGVPIGSFALLYEICDKQSPLACVEATATVEVHDNGGGAPATPVPTLNEWALIGLTALTALVGFGRLRRRQD